MNKKNLVPVSFHLRNFNNYIKLDLPASEIGNLTLIGRNMSGKTTLAHCFYPMLIDGSIATPSFNPAQNTNVLDKITTRNSSHDTHTFEEMLLGSGKGAMKYRTGYSYMLMRSNIRKVILGIGAHRAVGESSKPTWWFVAISKNVDDELNLVTVDENGKSLEKDKFIAANENMNFDFEVFSQVSAYQSYVAEKIYSFSDIKDLNKLANAYRLIASPILTAGNVSLTPILESLKNAQEGIDTQLIDSLAINQRELNTKKADSKKVTQAIERIDKLKKQIFWSNLNRLEELTLSPYSKNCKLRNDKLNANDRLKHELGSILQQLKKLDLNLQKSEEEFQSLEEKQNRQKIIEEQRQYMKKSIESLEKEINHFVDSKKRYEKILKELNKKQSDKKNLIAAKEEEMNGLVSLKNEIKEKFKLTLLNSLITKNDPRNLSEILGNYLNEMISLMRQYYNLENNQKNLSEDIGIVTDIQKNMDLKIDIRTKGPVVSRIRAGLREDNHEVHEEGRNKMDSHFKEFEKGKTILLQSNSDLKVFIDQKSLFEKLQKNVIKLNKIIDKIKLQNQEIKDLDKDINNLEDNKKNWEKEYKDFNLDEENEKVKTTKLQLEKLVIDPSLDEKVKKAKSYLNKYQSEKDNLSKKKNKLENDVETNELKIKELETEIEILTNSTEKNLKELAPYVINGYELETISETVNFLGKFKSKIKSYSFSDLSYKISQIIRKDSADGLDMIFEIRGHSKIARAIRGQNYLNKESLKVLSFDINEARKLMVGDESAIEKSLNQWEEGSEMALTTFAEAARYQISDQFDLIKDYNDMLDNKSKGIRLKISLKPVDIDEQVISEIRDNTLMQHSTLLDEIKRRLDRLANDLDLAEDEDTFMNKAHELLDVRQWLEFQIWIHLRHSEDGEFELIDDNFVKSGGSGAEKAQSMILPLLLVPKVILNRARASDAPHLVMFDEFADKLDPDTAKSFTKIIDQFGFNFIATMPSGAQNKVLADGVDNVAYDVISVDNKNDGKFYTNTVREALIWREA